MRALPFAALLLLLPLASSGAAEMHALAVRVVGVIDGDTIDVIDSNQLQHRIRLAGIDAPEKGQPFGQKSRQSLAELVHGKPVTMEWSKKDGYGRYVAKVLVGEPQRDVNLAQVSGGLAWHYKQFEKEQAKADRLAYANAERIAREQGLGLWSEPDPVPPWEWRHPGAPPPGGTQSGGAVKKSRSHICHTPEMASYPGVKNFTAYPTLEACVQSGGRPPRGNMASPAG